MFLSIIKRTEGDDMSLSQQSGKSGFEVLQQETNKKPTNPAIKAPNADDDNKDGKAGIKALKNKIKFVAKMAKMQKVLREERENIMKIKALNDNKLPQGILLNGKEAIQHFFDIKKNDAVNEMIPKYGYNRREYSREPSREPQNRVYSSRTIYR